MIPLAYLLSVAVALVVLAVALRHRPTPAPEPPDVPALPADLPADAATEIRVILTAATRLATTLGEAA